MRTGANISFLIELAGAKSIVGIDTSEKALEVARGALRFANVRFFHPSEYVPDGQADLVFCNGAFNHIPPGERGAAPDYLYRCLKQAACSCYGRTILRTWAHVT